MPGMVARRRASVSVRALMANYSSNVSICRSSACHSARMSCSKLRIRGTVLVCRACVKMLFELAPALRDSNSALHQYRARN